MRHASASFADVIVLTGGENAHFWRVEFFWELNFRNPTASESPSYFFWGVGGKEENARAGAVTVKSVRSYMAVY